MASLWVATGAVSRLLERCYSACNFGSDAILVQLIHSVPT
jgi:hypothetical protein